MIGGVARPSTPSPSAAAAGPLAFVVRGLVAPLPNQAGRSLYRVVSRDDGGVREHGLDCISFSVDSCVLCLGTSYMDARGGGLVHPPGTWVSDCRCTSQYLLRPLDRDTGLGAVLGCAPCFFGLVDSVSCISSAKRQ